MLSLLRLERKPKNSSNPFRIRIFLFLSYSFGIETINTFIHSRSSLKNHTRLYLFSDQNGAKTLPGGAVKWGVGRHMTELRGAWKRLGQILLHLQNLFKICDSFCRFLYKSILVRLFCSKIVAIIEQRFIMFPTHLSVNDLGVLAVAMVFGLIVVLLFMFDFVSKRHLRCSLL